MSTTTMNSTRKAHYQRQGQPSLGSLPEDASASAGLSYHQSQAIKSPIKLTLSSTSTTSTSTCSFGSRLRQSIRLSFFGTGSNHSSEGRKPLTFSDQVDKCRSAPNKGFSHRQSELHYLFDLDFSSSLHNQNTEEEEKLHKQEEEKEDPFTIGINTVGIGEFWNARVETFLSNIAFLMGNSEWQDQDDDDFYDDDDYHTPRKDRRQSSHTSTTDISVQSGNNHLQQMMSDDSFHMEQKIAAYSQSLQQDTSTQSTHTHTSNYEEDDPRHMSNMMLQDEFTEDYGEQPPQPEKRKDSFASLAF
ncbi:expressed unknown protein [Seminavis robusta]|uniref:Uncharacterized protein n=1 Tax=Seminavis robusta TaxID=568900 RepID=A0A9N8D9Q7_9STRA|nr:expressed unknown protein [Seminavis robusta]|eukprot:Sro48_g028270.1 n/a (302) ;mRNA; f:80127-81032